MSGYVRIHRSLIGHPAFRNDAEAMAFAWLVAKAAWKPARVRYKGRAVTLARGQVAISQRDMAFALDRDKAWIERLWKRLRAEAMVKVDSEAGVAVITICNYAEYQESKSAREAVDEADARQTQGTEQVREEVKEVSSEANASSPRAWACPAGVHPDHWRDFRANRKTRRLTNSPTAYAGQLRAIAELADDEWPPGRLVEYAAMKGWGSINKPDEGGFNGQANRGSGGSMGGPRTDPTLALVRAATAAQREDRGDHGQARSALSSGKFG